MEVARIATLRKSTKTRREISNVIAEFNIHLKNETIGYNVHGDRVKSNSVEQNAGAYDRRHSRRRPRRHRRRYRFRYNGRLHNCPRCRCKVIANKRNIKQTKRNTDNNRATIPQQGVNPPAIGCRIGVGILPMPLQCKYQLLFSTFSSKD